MLKGDAIAERLRAGRARDDNGLSITPEPDLAALEAGGQASVDLKLGTWFTALRRARVECTGAASGPVHESRLASRTYVPFGTRFVLHPRAFVLGITLEWIRLPGDLAAYVIGKSSWGRHGLVIATATAVHPGFAGCLTLELTNVGEIPIALKPGVEVCQLCLHELQTADTAVGERSSYAGSRLPLLGSLSMDTAEALSRL